MGSKGGKTVILPQAQAQTTSVAPNPVAMAAYQNVVGQAQNLQAENRGFTPDQQAAFSEVNQLQGVANPWINYAGQFAGEGLAAGNALINSGANAGSPQNFGQNINAYMSPYLDDVVRATMANINETNAQQQSQLTGNAIAQGALGGNRVGVAGSELARQQNLTNNSTLAQLLQQGYGQAGQNLFQNAGLQMQAGNALGSLGNQTAGIYSGLGNEALSTGLQGANALLQTGGMQQALPYQQLGWLSGIVGNQGPNMGQTGAQSSMGYSSQYAPSPNPLSSILGAGIAGVGAFLPKAEGGRVGKAHGGGLGEYDPRYDDYDSPVGGGFGAIPAVKPINPHGLQLPQFQGMQQPHQQQQEQDRSPSFADDLKAGKGLRGAYDRYSDTSAMDSFASDYASEPTIGGFGEWRGGRVRGYDDGGEVIDDTGGLGATTDDPTLSRMFKQESNDQQFDKNGQPLTSTKGAVGAAQVMPDTGPEAATLAGLPWDEQRWKYDKGYNKALGKAYYQAQLERFGGDPVKAAAAYNGGPTRLAGALARAQATGGNWLSYMPAETRNYVANVTGGGLGAINSAAPIAMADSSGGLGGGLTEGRSADTGVAPPDAEPGFLEKLGVPKISPDTRAALISAGLGMMASKSHWLGPAIGEGGLAGVKAYYENQQNARQNALNQSTIGYRAGELALKQRQQDIVEQKLQQLADTAVRARTQLPNFGGQQPMAGGTAIPTGGSSNPGAPMPLVPGAASPIAVNNTGRPPLRQTATPEFYDQRAAMLEQRATEVALTPAAQQMYYGQAQDARKMALELREKGITQDANGNIVSLPGAVETAAAKQRAIKIAETPASTSSGEEYFGGEETAQSTQRAPANPASGAQPERAQIDPRSAEVKTAIPPAPSGGGFPTPDIPAGAKLTKIGDPAKELAKNDADFSKDVIPRAPTIDTAIERYRSLAQAFKKFESGSTVERQSAYAAFAAAIGQKGIANQILNGGDQAVQGVEWVKKEGINVVLDTLRAATPRFAQSEFNKLSEQGVPNPTIRPETNQRLVAEGLGQLMHHKQFIEDWGQAQQQGWKSISSFYTQWSKANPMGAFIASAQRQIGNFKGMDVPPRDKWVENGVYTAPTTMTPAQKQAYGKRGVQEGQMFRYDGQSIAPIKGDETFSTYGPPLTVPVPARTSGGGQ